MSSSLKTKWVSVTSNYTYTTIIEPFIDEVSEKIKRFTVDNNQTKTIIQRFDEIILEKASKFSIEQIYQTLKMYINNSTFSGFKQEFDKGLNDLKRHINQVESSFCNTKQDITDEMEKAVKQAFLKLKKSIYGEFLMVCLCFTNI